MTHHVALAPIFACGYTQRWRTMRIPDGSSRIQDMVIMMAWASTHWGSLLVVVATEPEAMLRLKPPAESWSPKPG